MVEVHLTKGEENVLSGLVESELRTLVSEIQHTDSRDFKEKLREKKTTLEQIRKKLIH